MKHVEISLMKDGELSIDGQSQPAENIEIREFEDGECMGGSYITEEKLLEKVKEAFLEDGKLSIDWIEERTYDNYGDIYKK